MGVLTHGAPVVKVANATALAGPRHLLQRAATANLAKAKPVKKSALSKAQEEAFVKGYVLQFVGLANNGIEPRDPMDDKTKSRCLKAIGQDDIEGGHGLSFGKCPHFVQKNKFGVPTGDDSEPKPDMLFQFTYEGRIRNVQTGKCIRRMKCGPDPGPLMPNRPYIYDLGFCDEQSVAVFDTWGARANRADQFQPIGNPLNAVEGPCEACGPFKLCQHCKGSCDSPVVTTGWTKMPSAFLIPDKGTQKSVWLHPGPFVDGLCGSYLKDDEDTESWFYFHKYDLKSQSSKAVAK